MKTFRYYLYEKQFSPSSIHEMERSVSQFLNYLKEEHIPVQQCSYPDVMGYVSHLQLSDKKPSYINQMLGHLRHYFTYLTGIKQARHNPVTGIRIKRALKHKIVSNLKEEELVFVYKAFQQQLNYNDSLLKQRDAVMLGLLIFQAVQINELQALLTTDINLFEGNIQVPETKRSQSRILAFQAIQMASVTNYLKDKPTEMLFNVDTGRQLTRILTRLSKLTNMALSHQLIRQSRIIYWLEHYHIRQVQYFAGMRYISSLKKYQEQEINGLRDKVDRFHPLG